MAPFKWSFFLFLGGILLLGLPIRAESETPTDEVKPSSVKECRVHIEKALEQYWEQKEPSDKKNNNLENKNQNENIENEEYEENLHSAVNNEKEVSDNDEEEDDDDQDEELSDEQNEEENNKEENGNQEDVSNRTEEDEDQSEEDDDEEDEEDLENETEEDNNTSDNEAIRKDETDEAQSSEETEEHDHDNHDEDESEEEEDTETEYAAEENKDESEGDVGKGKSEEDDHDAEVGTEEEEEAEEEEEEEEEEQGEAGEEEETQEKVEGEEDEDEEENEEEQEEEEEGEEELTEEESEQQESQIDESVTNESTVGEETITSPDEQQAESEKVTGEADRASVGMASEFLEKEPSVEQPEASEVEEETLDVTTPEGKDESGAEEDEETQKSETGSEIGDETEEKDEDTIENIYEEDEDDSSSGLTFRSRDHIDVILGLDEIGTEYDKEEEKLAQSIFREIKKIHFTSIRPMEMLYKYADSTTRVLGDAEIFNKPMLLFLGPWSSGKTTIINYLLGIERTPIALKTGTGITDVDFTLITYGDQRQVVSGTELAADWRYAGVQKFGQGFLDHFRSIHIPHTLLKKVTIIDTPGILENRKNTERGYPFNDAFQWFIDRADAIYVVLDPTKVDIGGELGSVIDQLKGRDVRFILNKADTIRRSDLMRVVGQLFWNLSPLMSSTEAPIIYAVSLTTKPFHPSAPAKFLADQEKNFLYDMKDTLDKKVENRILYARRHAVRVRNHAKMVDCYLATYYRHKSIFSSKKNVAKLITENPREYNIFDGIGSMTNVSRYDLPDPVAYKEFFKLHSLYDFKPLASTCSYFRGCPMDKLDEAIAKDIPELFAKYKKAKSSTLDASKQEGR